MDSLAVRAGDEGTLVAEHTPMPGYDEERVNGPTRPLAEFRQFVSFPHSDISLLSSDSGGGFVNEPLPKSIAKPLIDMLMAVVSGKTVVVLSIPREINIKQVAPILNIDHLEVLRLFDEDEVSYRIADGERVVPLPALFDYKIRDKERTRELISELTRETQLMGLYEI